MILNYSLFLIIPFYWHEIDFIEFKVRRIALLRRSFNYTVDSCDEHAIIYSLLALLRLRIRSGHEIILKLLIYE